MSVNVIKTAVFRYIGNIMAVMAPEATVEQNNVLLLQDETS